MKYPYYIVQVRTGRLPSPLEYKHTPIERMFTSGKIGGTQMREHRAETKEEAWQIADRQNRSATVEVYVVPAPNQYRHRIRKGQR